jgi:hypothetical protein
MICIHPFSLGDELLAFGMVIAQMLEDVQERLVYRAQVDLLHYVLVAY